MRTGRVPWVELWDEPIKAWLGASNQLLGCFEFPELAFAPTFRILITGYAAGSVNSSIRFGFSRSELNIFTAPGVVFGAMTGLFASRLRNVVADRGAVDPRVDGSPAIFLPPIGGLFVTIPVNSILGFTLYGAAGSL
jgi:hypothetical protein